MNKYLYIFVLQGNYGYGDGYEDLVAEDYYRDIKQRLKEYNLNEKPYTSVTYRIIERREPNPEKDASGVA